MRKPRHQSEDSHVQRDRPHKDSTKKHGLLYTHIRILIYILHIFIFLTHFNIVEANQKDPNILRKMIPLDAPAAWRLKHWPFTIQKITDQTLSFGSSTKLWIYDGISWIWSIKCARMKCMYNDENITAWWWLEHGWIMTFHEKLGMSSSQLTFTPSFFRGVGSTTNQSLFHIYSYIYIPYIIPI